MTKTQNLIASVGLAVACGVVFKAALSNSGNSGNTDKAPASVAFQQSSTNLAQNNLKPAQAPAPAPAVASPTPVPPLAPIAENDTQTGTETGGKDVVPVDGKEVIPTDGKELLPPVGVFIPTRPSSVEPSNGAPPVEYLNPYTNPNNQLLTPPNPMNVSGPVVSPETR